MENKLSTFQKFVSTILQSLIQIYQILFAPLLGHNCRYIPSCSNYGIEAVELHGPVRGSWLAIKRICRCHPWGDHGLDPVPSHDTEDHASNFTPDHVSATMLSKG